MKKPIRTLLGLSVAAVLGSILLLGGAGSLAFWSDSSTSATQQIQSGSLDLGTSSQMTFANATIKQCAPTCTSSTPSVAYAGGPLVPGDVVTATVNVPVTLVGQNLKARFAVTPTKNPTVASAAADVALSNAMSITVKQINGATATSPAALTLTPAQIANGTVPVVLEVAFPWGTAGQYNDAMGGKVSLAATYTLTQIAAG
ncbi:alternate signal-mediated exported protein [Mycetocola sp. CAN_C7]|uniref:alternate-type signal peptide domain-containing protein n=1 Tax=Mycetocola sp. CAN_C7 TaxID=2787724 RepID=UPI0018C90CAD